MKISSKGEYALRALIVLGAQYPQLVQTKDIARETLVPSNYLEQILLLLKNLGYVKSKRGASGGYTLKIEPSQICIGDIVRDIEGPLAPMSCVSVTAYEHCPLEEQACLLQPLWRLVRDVVADLLDHTSLENLLNGNLPTRSK
ncbi:Rrf2 family protein [Fictibacillus halophilus]|uniref:Rrf2 family protein n=1 Tax=Fictibacillus halophilus TaxID=1610490 RepID=A0ABV2LDQ3_9BACL|nr:Rrf2 family transcriptional regulator [Fictibacillus halophilus]